MELVGYSSNNSAKKNLFGGGKRRGDEKDDVLDLTVDSPPPKKSKGNNNNRRSIALQIDSRHSNPSAFVSRTAQADAAAAAAEARNKKPDVEVIDLYAETKTHVWENGATKLAPGTLAGGTSASGRNMPSSTSFASGEKSS